MGSLNPEDKKQSSPSLHSRLTLTLIHAYSHHGILYGHARNILPLFKKLHSRNGTLGKFVLRVFSCSHVASLIALSIHSILNSRITLVCKFFVLTSRIIPGICGLEDKSSEVTRVSVVTVIVT